MLLPTYKKGWISTEDGAALHYLRIGEGLISIVVIPGAGDGLSILPKVAKRLVLYFRKRLPNYRLLIFSRRQPLPPNFGFENHASDLLWLLDQLEWGRTIFECNSAGGPIGQWVAFQAPHLTRGLILSCTLHRSNEITSAVVQHWMQLIAQGKWWEFTWSSIECTFRPQTVNRNRLLKPLLPLISPPPQDPIRITNTLLELLDFDDRHLLPEIHCPTLVIGGKEDQIIPSAIQHEMASLLPDSRLKLYPGYGHGIDQENPEYEREVFLFSEECLLM